MNPIYGSVGLLWSGSWQLCQNAVEAVLKGAPITQITSDTAETNNGPPLKAYDIRHISKDDNLARSTDLHRVRTRCRFKRSAAKPKASRVWVASGDESGHEEINRSTSHESSLSHQSEAAQNVEGESRESESLASEQTAEASVLFRSEPEPKPEQGYEDGEIELELTLGFEPVSRAGSASPNKDIKLRDDGVCKMELGLNCPA